MTTVSTNASVSSLLAESARLFPQRAAVICGGRTLTFRKLEAEVALLASGFTAAGIGRGTRTVVMVPPGAEFIALAFALLRNGAVPVLVDPGIGWRNLGTALAEAEPEAFVGTPKAHLARVLGGWAKDTVRLTVTVGSPALWGSSLGHVRDLGRLDWEPPALEAAESAAILFTSGSTGIPKGAVYTHGIFVAQADLLREIFRIRPGEVSVATFPLFGLFDVALGMTAVIPDMDASRPASADPGRIFEAIRAHEAVQLFASPALLDKLGRHGEAAGEKLPTLRRVLSAGAPVSPRIVERFSKLLSAGAEIYTPYGATEALPVTLISGREILAETGALTARGNGACVGRPVPGIEVRIIRISDGPVSEWSEGLEVPDGQIGEISVAGPVVSPRYHNRPVESGLSKILGHGRLWHRMGDLGWKDALGRIWFCGRKSQRVRTPAGELYTIPCEGVFNAHPRVRRTALVGVGPAGAQVPVLCVELEKGADAQTLRAELRALGAAHPHTCRIATILFHPGFPVDIRHNAKIFREKLAVWAARSIR